MHKSAVKSAAIYVLVKILACPLQCIHHGTKTPWDTQEAAKAVQQLDNILQWCQDTGSLINPRKSQTLCCTLDKRAAGKVIPAATVDGAVAEWTSIWDTLGSTSKNADLQKTCVNNFVDCSEKCCKKVLDVNLPASGASTTVCQVLEANSTECEIQLLILWK